MKSEEPLNSQDDVDLLTIYRSWTPEDLAYLRHAFKLDLEHAEAKERNTRTAAFCRDRLALIDQVFREREKAMP